MTDSPRRGMPIGDRVGAWGDRVAVVDPSGTWTFADLDAAAAAAAAHLVEGGDDLSGQRIGVLAEPGHDYVISLLATWRVGAIALPLLPANPEPELAALAEDAGVVGFMVSLQHWATGESLSVHLGGGPFVHAVPADRTAPEPAASTTPADAPALMIHTSGTTGRPKGAVHLHRGLAAMVDGMLDAWAWTPDDRIVLVLPLNHMHGVVNVVLTALAAGATCEAPGRFDAVAVWERFTSGAVTVFMAVPTIYARLVAAWEAADAATQRRWTAGARQLRLMVCGSAALPVPTLERWEALTGHVLLERYGMTELGMVLSNTLDQRVPGHVGWPMPGVEVRIVDDVGRDVADGQSGELLVRGDNVFAGYWQRPEATAEALVDGWFRTGDVAILEPDGYRLLGRSSVDIIKSGGEKLSAIEIEASYREHPDVADLAVVGLEDAEWGERVAAAVVLREPGRGDAATLRAWGKERMAAPKVPSRWLFVDELPRNTLGKVVKPRVKGLFTDA